MALAACSLGVFSSAQTNYDFSKLQREKLGRGVVAVRENAQKVAVSWRYLSSDPMETAFNVYRNGKKIEFCHRTDAPRRTDEKETQQMH